MNKIHQNVKAQKQAALTDQKEGPKQPIQKVVTKTVHYGAPKSASVKAQKRPKKK
jgi:hypothetical protein